MCLETEPNKHMCSLTCFLQIIFTIFSMWASSGHPVIQSDHHCGFSSLLKFSNQNVGSTGRNWISQGYNHCWEWHVLVRAHVPNVLYMCLVGMVFKCLLYLDTVLTIFLFDFVSQWWADFKFHRVLNMKPCMPTNFCQRKQFGWPRTALCESHTPRDPFIVLFQQEVARRHL